MKAAAIGCGYLGAVHASAMTVLGHEIVGVDIHAHQLEQLVVGKPPFYEPTGGSISGSWR
jgi:UDPglucose 6-dehydrogenase